MNYHLEVKENDTSRTSYVYDENQTLVSKSIYDFETGGLTTYDYSTGEILIQSVLADDNSYDIFSFSKNADNISILASPNYRYVTTHTGQLKYAAYTVAAIAGAIAALVPGIGWAVAVALANAIIADKITNLKYTVDLYSASSGNTFYTKRVFKAYDKYTGKKVGPTVTGYTTSHHK